MRQTIPFFYHYLLRKSSYDKRFGNTMEFDIQEFMQEIPRLHSKPVDADFDGAMQFAR